jgi:hypothetical protein
MSDQEDVNVQRLTRLDVINSRKGTSFESVRNFKLLRELNLINIGEVRNFDFLSSLDELKIIRLVNIKDIGDYDGFRYATALEKVFISEINDAALEELRNALKQCNCQSYYWSDFLIRKADIRGTPGVQFWTTPEINQFKIDVGFR